MKTISLKTLALFVFVASSIILEAQCEDVTPTAVKILSGENVESYDLQIIGACVDEVGTFHLTGKLDGISHLALASLGFDDARIKMIQTLEPFFTSVRAILKTFPSVQLVRFYYVTFEKVRNKYGDLIEERKIIKNMIGITRRTVEKINWEYIEENLKPIMGYGDVDELYDMLDEIYIQNQWIRKN